MKLIFGSDFHVEHGADVAGMLRPYVEPGNTILLAGGDIATRGATVDALVELALDLECKVIGTTGNHDYYGLDLSTADTMFREEAQRYPEVLFLNNESTVLGDVHLWVSCFWSDFSGPHEDSVAVGRRAFQQGIADARAIRVPSRSTLRPLDYLTADDVVRLHQTACASLEVWLDECDRLDVPRNKRMVMTHFTPTPALIQEKYRGSPFNSYFAPDARRYFSRVGTWLCGHTHGPGDVTENGCRIINGSMGYPGEITGWTPVQLGTV